MATFLTTKNVTADYVLLVVIAIGCVVPALIIGPPVGHGDLQHHLQVANSYVDSFQAGIFHPSWTDEENKAYGGVTVRSYPPFAHYLIASSKLLFGSWHLATFAAFAVLSFVGSLGVYIWARDVFRDRTASLFAATLFAISPYHLNQYYQSFMWAEFAALSVMPFVFLFARRIIVEGRIDAVIGLAVVYGLLVLSNVPQLAIGTLGLGIYGLCLLDRDKIRTNLPKLVIGGVIGLMLTAYFWARMLPEMKWLVISVPNTDPNYDFRNHFLLNSFVLDDRFAWFASLFLIIAALSAILAVVTSGTAMKFFRERDIRAIALFGLVAIFIMTPASRLVWEALEPLQRIQFPWRFLSLTCIAAAMLVGYSVSMIRSMEPVRARPRMIILFGILAVTATFSIKQVILAAVYSDPARFETYASVVANRNSLDHWLPTWAPSSAFTPATRIQTNTRAVNVTDWKGTVRRFTVEPGESDRIRLGLMYHPFWQARINGQPAETLQINGAVGLDIGPERSEVEVVLIEPSYVTASRIASILTGLAVIVASLFMFGYKRQPTKIK